ncbi:MAG: hypothetical protein HOO06_11630 [Bdellovibrionaceae bacterium]|nr:hypothetical protein [Pseudobdellovibrionaceae bacterium]
MSSMIISVLAVTFFCTSCFFLIQSLTQYRGLVFSTEYSRQALKVERFYKVFAWSLLSLFLFNSMVWSFYQTFLEL